MCKIKNLQMQLDWPGRLHSSSPAQTPWKGRDLDGRMCYEHAWRKASENNIKKCIILWLYQFLTAKGKLYLNYHKITWNEILQHDLCKKLNTKTDFYQHFIIILNSYSIFIDTRAQYLPFLRFHIFSLNLICWSVID